MISFLLSPVASAQEPERDLAKELANPIATLYTLPLQMNFDEGLGLNGDGSLYQLNAQPLIPFSLNEDWNLISRTIVPLIHQEDVTGPGESQTGVGDVLESLFLSPSQVGESGWVWGVGPAISLPTASEDVLGIDSWALGPTAVALKQQGPWTVGVLANHLWTVSGDADVSSSYVEPWVSYVLPSNTTVSLSAETVYDWNASDMGMPVNFIVDQLVTVWDQPISIGVAVKYWADTVEGGPEDWGFRLQATFIWPK